MKKLTINFNVIVSDKNYDESGFKDLVELIESGQWDVDTLKQDKVESSLSSVTVEEIKETKELKDEE